MKKIVSIIGLLLILIIAPVLFLSHNEKTNIDRWIKVNGFNEFGDIQETGYLGGNPLFNEGRGGYVYKDRYDYIEKHHPDKPWDK